MRSLGEWRPRVWPYVARDRVLLNPSARALDVVMVGDLVDGCPSAESCTGTPRNCSVGSVGLDRRVLFLIHTYTYMRCFLHLFGS